MGFSLVTLAPFAFWLIPPVLAALILFRLYRTRRVEIITGSLLLWRRLAAQQPKAQPKRVIIDRSLLLQAAALLALIAALAQPTLGTGGARGRALLLMLDNGPLARARGGDGAMLWKRVQEKTKELLRGLKAGDVVYLARTSPLPKMLTPQGAPPQTAADLVDAMQPALSCPAVEQSGSFAADAARNIGNGTQPAVVVLSQQAGPDTWQAGQPVPLRQWVCVATAGELANVGIVDFGALPVAYDGAAKIEVLARIRNLSSQSVEGSMHLESLDSAAKPDRASVELKLLPGADEAVVFALPHEPASAIRIAWRRADGKPDALPEDDVVIATPRSVRAPRVRFHAPVPALEKLYRVALNAELISPQDSGGADLEIYTGSVPERVPENSRGVLLLAPESGYRMVFDVGDKTLNWPKVQRDEEHRLTRGIADKPGGIFPVPQAVEILATGDFSKLLRDEQTQRALAARFTDERGRFGLLLAFVPGAGFPPERPLEPELAALLVRAALEAAGTGEPFEVRRAAALEMQRGEPLPAEWTPDTERTSQGGAGVLDERASQLVMGKASEQDFDLAALQPLERAQVTDLRPWLIALALLLAAVEWRTKQ